MNVPTPQKEMVTDRGKDSAEASAALHEAATFAASVVRPQLGDNRCSSCPFRANRDTNEKAQDRQGLLIPGQRAQPGGQRVGEDRQNHGPLAADIIGDNSADHSAYPPAEESASNDIAGIARDGRVLVRRNQLVQSKAHG